MKRLRDAHARTLGVWKGLITANPSEHALTEAFMKFLEEFPDAKKRVSGPNPDATMLSLCVHRLFPSLASTAPEIVVRIITDLMGVMIANTQVCALMYVHFLPSPPTQPLSDYLKKNK